MYNQDGQAITRNSEIKDTFHSLLEITYITIQAIIEYLLEGEIKPWGSVTAILPTTFDDKCLSKETSRM